MKRTLEQSVTLRRRGPRSSQSPSEEEGPGAPRHHWNKRPHLPPIQGRNGKTSMQKQMQQHKNKTSPESSPPPTPRPEHCNVDKAEKNDVKSSLMKMIKKALERKMKNAAKEIEEKTNNKLEEINKEIEEKKKNERNE
ncbi:hypothetical protein STEG23_023468 [Scotinomys teguina]